MEVFGPWRLLDRVTVCRMTVTTPRNHNLQMVLFGNLIRQVVHTVTMAGNSDNNTANTANNAATNADNNNNNPPAIANNNNTHPRTPTRSCPSMSSDPWDLQRRCVIPNRTENMDTTTLLRAP